MKAALERAGLAVLGRIDPERAHALALRAIRVGLAPTPGPITSARLACRLAGLDLPNPLGIAAGFDKDGVAIGGLLRSGAGFVELGGVTPRPQPGNPRPRLFRLPADQAVINRFGFNSAGMEAVAERLARPRPAGILGVNLGANKDSRDRAADMVAVLTRLGPMVDFAVINVSSPNTERLRDLQGQAALAALLAEARTAKDALPRPLPLFLKIAPDLDDAALAGIAEVAEAAGIDAIVATNTTLERSGLRDPAAREAGGLSGRPLFERSTRVLAKLAVLTEGRVPLVGVGGIGSGADAYAKIKAGASALQLYSALTRGGLSLIATILRDLETLLGRDGFDNPAEAVGIEAAARAAG